MLPGKSAVVLVIFDVVGSFVAVVVFVVDVGPSTFEGVVDSLPGSVIIGPVFFDVVVDSSVKEIVVCCVISGVDVDLFVDIVDVLEHVR